MRTSRFKQAVIFAAALLTLASGPARATPIKILAFGTSLTQGYGLPPGTEYTTALQEKLNAAGVDARIINAGVSGDTSADGLSRLDWSLADKPQAALVEMGSNDALRGFGSLPRLPEKNLNAILTKLKAAHVAKSCFAEIARTTQSRPGVRGPIRCDLPQARETTWRAFLSFHSRRRRFESEAQPGRWHPPKSSGCENHRESNLALRATTDRCAPLMKRRPKLWM